MEIQCNGKGAEIYGKIKQKFADYKSQGKLAFISNVDWNDQSNIATASGSGFKAKIQCQDNKVLVDLDLNFLLKAMRGQIEEKIRGLVAKSLT